MILKKFAETGFLAFVKPLIVTSQKKMRRHFLWDRSTVSHSASFTLVELLIVIGILAILTVAVIVVLNPVEYLKQARDSKRIQDLSSLNKALSTLEAVDPTINFGTASTVYVSVPDTDSGCANLGLPNLPSGWSYACVTSANL